MTLTVESDLSPQFTLTCISTGGPATTVTWTRDSATAMGDAVTVFNDVTTAWYTHTLTVTGRLGGDYQCTVSNVKPSSASAIVSEFMVQHTTSYTASDLSPQFTLTCISTGGPATTVTWTRDSATAMGDAVTVFNDVTTAWYTRTLTVTGRLGGDYQCTVSNVKPSSASGSLRIQGTAYNLLHCKSNSVHAFV